MISLESREAINLPAPISNYTTWYWHGYSVTIYNNVHVLPSMTVVTIRSPALQYWMMIFMPVMCESGHPDS